MNESAAALEIISLEPTHSAGLVWFLGIAIAIAIACFTYANERQSLTRFERCGLAACRALVLLLLGWMILGWRQTTTPAEKPELVILADVSTSMLADEHPARTSDGSLTRWQTLTTAMLAQQSRWDELARDYRLTWSFHGSGAELQRGTASEMLRDFQSAQPTETQSPLGSQLLSMLNQQRGRPTAAVIFLTDGNVTEGLTLPSAAERARERLLPLHLAGVGRTDSAIEWRIEQLMVDSRAFVGDTLRFVVRVSASAAKLPTRLQLFANDEMVSAVEVSPSPHPQEVVLLHRAEKIGSQSFRVALEAAAEENNTQNNVAHAQIDIRPFDASILIAWGTPSYEFRYLKGVLERDLANQSRVEAKAGENGPQPPRLQVFLQEADPEYAFADKHAIRNFPADRKGLKSYGVIILGELDLKGLGKGALANLLDYVQEDGGSLVIVAGERFGLSHFADTPLADLLPTDDLSTREFATENRPLSLQPTPLGQAWPVLQLSESVAESQRVWENSPPLYWHHPLEKLRPAVRIFAEITEPSSGKRQPVITGHYAGQGEVILHATDELHRWRFRRGDLYFGRYWEQLVRYLARRKISAEAIELTSRLPEYRLGEAVELQLHFHNEQSAPTAAEFVEVQLLPPDADPQPIPFRSDSLARGRFHATLAGLPAGTYQAKLIAPAKQPQPTLSFTILQPPGENLLAPLNETECQAAALISGGSYRPIAQLAELLGELPPARLVPAAAKSSISLWNSVALALLVVLLLAGEWWWRLRLGLF